MRPSDLDPVEHSGAGLPTDHELEDGRAWKWIAVAQDARKGHEDAPATEILIRTAYLMLVRFDFSGSTRAGYPRTRPRAETLIVRDVMNCAAIACETPWPTDHQGVPRVRSVLADTDHADVAMCFVTLYQTIQEKRNERALRGTYTDEIDKIACRSRLAYYLRAVVPALVAARAASR